MVAVEVEPSKTTAPYACGLPWLAYQLDTNLTTTLEYGLYPFVIGDTIKLYLAAVLLSAVWGLTTRP